MRYRIGNMTLAFRSNGTLTANEAWEKFRAASSSPADFTYECRLSSRLPQIGDAQNTHHYFEQMTQKCYAITREQDGQMFIHLSEENLPWGTELNQIYEQLALPHVLLRKDMLLLHAAYISTSKGAILFTAPSGTGKSTQAELWKQYRNAFIVNGDRAVIGLEEGVPTAYGFPISGSSTDCHNRSAKIRAIISLRQAPKNSVKRLTVAQGVQVLVNGTYLPPAYQDDLSRTIDASLLIAQSVPIFELSCLPDESAVIALEEALER